MNICVYTAKILINDYFYLLIYQTIVFKQFF